MHDFTLHHMWKFCALHLFCWTVLFIQLNHNAYCQQAVRPTMKDVKVLKEFQKIPEFHFQNTVDTLAYCVPRHWLN